jgi:HK97 family phage prohead protease
MTVLPAEDFLKEVNEETVAFNYGFGLHPEGKADQEAVLDSATVRELDDGDLLIEGWAANFEGLDRQHENFEDGAFQRGIKSFLNGTGALCYHHKNDMGIGRVLDLKEVEGKGLYMKARVSKQEPSSPLYYIYNAVKKGDYRGLSVGGYFKRRHTPKGPRIADVDFTEISVTPVPVPEVEDDAELTYLESVRSRLEQLVNALEARYA